MSEINYFKVFVQFSGDVAADVDNLHVKRIYLEPLVDHLYIVREDFTQCTTIQHEAPQCIEIH
jgi:hypothetical protein